jgi:hypothetical protein
MADAEPVACALDPEELKEVFWLALPRTCARSAKRPMGTSSRSRLHARFLQLVDVIDAERQCCRLLKFELIVQPAEGSVKLRLGGPPGTREFLSSLLDLKPV